MSAPEGVALVGSGIFAREQHLRAILATPQLSLKAVYSRRLAPIAQMCEGLAQKIDWYSDETAAEGRGFKDMLANPNIKGVIIALPILAQPDFIRAALRAGKHVLSEKPIAKDVAAARELIEWYLHSGEVDTGRARWCVAENWRWTDEMQAAREALPKLGRILEFRFKANSQVEVGGKYFETAWRKTPEYQGGFVLDAGVHYAAGLRLLLGKEHALQRVSAFSAQLQEHLPPVDTVNATARTKSGITGTFAISMSTTFPRGPELAIAGEKGSLVTGKGFLTVKPKDGPEMTKRFGDSASPEEASGVLNEVRAWTHGVLGGDFDGLLSPEEALADLEVVEAILRSGEHDGNPVTLTLQ